MDILEEYFEMKQSTREALIDKIKANPDLKWRYILQFSLDRLHYIAKNPVVFLELYSASVKIMFALGGALAIFFAEFLNHFNVNSNLSNLIGMSIALILDMYFYIFKPELTKVVFSFLKPYILTAFIVEYISFFMVSIHVFD